MSSVRLAALAALVGCASLWGTVAHAQVYRIIGADGRVTFSDRPPPDGKATPAPSMPMPPTAAAGIGSGTAALPMELRGAATRFPVTLYTGKDCAPCEAARIFLTSRGIPFAEKSVSSNADLRALRNLSGSNSLPFGTIGGQHLVGFSEAEWSQYMDAAGYPRTSQLPPGYRNAPATPLVAVEAPRRPDPATPQAAARPQPQPQDAPQPLPSDPSPSNPLGIRF